MLTGSGLAAVGFGLAASLAWGTSDFSGGLAAKRAPIVFVMTISYGVGLVLLVGTALVRAEPLPSGADVAWASAAGLCGSLGLTAQYRALAVGRMGLNAPVAAVLAAALPVAFAGLTEGLPGELTLAGFAVGLLAVWLIARPANGADPAENTRKGLELAFVAGLGFGVFFILLDRVSQNAVFWPLAAARTASLLVMLGFLLGVRRTRPLTSRALPVIALAGMLDVGGNTFFLLAAQAGRLDVATVLSSLYPAVTVLLARVILAEHLSRAQVAGVLAALAAIVLIMV